jgi:hypothetical protein
MTDQATNTAQIKARLAELVEFLDESFTAENPMSKHCSRATIGQIDDIEYEIREWEGIDEADEVAGTAWVDLDIHRDMKKDDQE